MASANENDFFSWFGILQVAPTTRQLMTTQKAAEFPFLYYGASTTVPATLTNTYHFPVLPGGYMVQPSGTGSFPIFESIPSLTPAQIYMDNVNDTHIVMPGFKLTYFDEGGYTGAFGVYNNTSYPTSDGGADYGANRVTAVKLFYHTVEISMTPKYSRTSAQTQWPTYITSNWTVPATMPFMFKNPFALVETIDSTDVIDYYPQVVNNTTSIGTGITLSGSGGIQGTDGWYYIPSNTQTVKMPSVTLTDNTEGFTFACWFKLTGRVNNGTTSNWNRIFDFSTAENSGAVNFGLGFNDSAEPFAITFFNNGGSLNVSPTTTGTTRYVTNHSLYYNQVYHVCFVIEPQGAGMQLYLNGNLGKTGLTASQAYPKLNTQFISCLVGKSNTTIDAYSLCYVSQLFRAKRAFTPSEVYYLASRQSVMDIIQVSALPTLAVSTNKFTDMFPLFPGAYMIDGGTGATPIYSSYNVVGTDTNVKLHDRDDAFLVMPGFRLVVYTTTGTSFSGSTTTVDNTRGLKPMYANSRYPNNAYSMKLYYGADEVVTGGSPFSTKSSNTTTANNSVPRSFPFVYKAGTFNSGTVSTTDEFPSFPGVYLVNGGFGVFPLYVSWRSLSALSWHDVVDSYIILPGFKVIVYESNGYTGTARTFDNTNGYNIMIGDNFGVNTASSIRLYFRNVAINDNKNISNTQNYWS
jgi:hypothetical protein